MSLKLAYLHLSLGFLLNSGFIIRFFCQSHLSFYSGMWSVTNYNRTCSKLCHQQVKRPQCNVHSLLKTQSNGYSANLFFFYSFFFFSYGLACKVQWNNMNAIICPQFYRCLVTKVKGDCLVFIKKKKRQFLQKHHAQEKNVYLNLHSVDCCFVFSLIFTKLLSGKGLFSQWQQFFTWVWAKSLMLRSSTLARPWHPGWWEEKVM